VLSTASHTDKVLLCVRKLITELDDGIQQPAHSETSSASHARHSQRATVEEVEEEEEEAPSNANNPPNPPQGSRKRPRVSAELPFPEPPSDTSKRLPAVSMSVVLWREEEL
jgi:hypothetical protein